jgi:hypothetical protein
MKGNVKHGQYREPTDIKRHKRRREGEKWVRIIGARRPGRGSGTQCPTVLHVLVFLGSVFICRLYTLAI